MRFTCNIDARGKRARLIYGLILFVIGIVLAVALAFPSGSRWMWAIAIACVLMGAFAIFEAQVGWCAVRAMGFKTRM